MSEIAVGILSGLLHPLRTPAHILVLLGLGLMIAQQSSLRVVAPIAFASGLAAGLVAIALGTGETCAPDVLPALAAIQGLAAAFALSTGRIGGIVIALLTGGMIGLDSAPDVISLTVGDAVLAGVGLGACLALAFIAGIAGSIRARVGLVPLRVAGSWCAASAILVIALRIAGR
jgi:hypothetical protein